MAMSKKKEIGDLFVGVPVSTENKTSQPSYVGYAKFTSLVQISKIPFKMCHTLIGNPTLISSFCCTKIDSAVPYDSAGHWAILNIQYIAMRAKRHFVSVKSEWSRNVCTLRSGHFIRLVRWPQYIYTK